MAWSFGIIDAHGRKGRATVVRRRKAHPAADRSTGRRIPRDVNVVTIRTRDVLIRRDHRFVVEMVRAAFKTEKAHSRIGLAPVRRSRDGHLASVHASAVAKEHNDVAVEKITPAI